MAILGDLLVQGSSRFLQHIYASSLTISDDFAATGDLSVGGAATIAGTLTLTKAQDLSGTANSGPALIVGGAATTAHMEIDANEIQAKKTGTTTDILYLNHDGGEVQISKSGVATKILGTLTTSGAATFSSTTTFTGASTHNGNLTVNGTSSLKGTGISGTLTVSGATTLADTSITDLTVSNNARINKTLIVEEEIRSPKWLIDNIANLGGEFIVAPTIIAENATAVQVAQANGTTRLLTITDNSITSDTFGGIVWKAGSIVKISGTLGDTVLTSVNGTMTEKLNTSSKVLRVNVATDDLDGIPAATTTYSLSEGTIKNLHIMMYKVGGTVPVGIFLTSYGNSIDHYPYLEVYSGTTTGTSYSPTVRLGYLSSLKNDDGTDLTVNNVTPAGWGLYTSNGYFSGTIVSNSGKIGGWEIGTASLWNGTTSMNDTHAGLYFGSDGGTTPKWGIRSYKDADTYVNIIDGKITALGVDLSGAITASSGAIGGFAIDSTSIHTKNVAVTSNADNSIGFSSADFTRTIDDTSRAGLRLAIGDKFGVTGDGAIFASSATVSGTITATAGAIGGFAIDSTSIHTNKIAVTSNADNSVALSSADFTRTINGTSREGLRFAVGDKFGVTGDGAIFASSANISGTITSSAGNIGGFTIGTSSIYKTQTNYNSGTAGVYIGTNGIGLGAGKFYVTSAGSLKATSGTIAGWTIGDNTISHGTLGQTSGYMLNSAGNSDTTINGTNKTNWALTIGSKFGVDKEGNLYANGANITSINANNINAGTINVSYLPDNVKNENIQIGGRNLLLNSKIFDPEKIPYTNSATDIYNTSEGYTYYYMSGISYVRVDFGNELEVNGTYIFSFDARRQASNQPIWCSINGLAYENLGTVLTTAWTRFSIPVTGTSGNNYAIIRMAETETTKTGSSRYMGCVRHFKLEKGNIATDWTAAPEDTEADLNSIRTWYATCNTTAATAAKVATITPETTDFTLEIGRTVNVVFSITNTAAVGNLTLNINNTGAKSIKAIRNASYANLANHPQKNVVYQFTYDGTYWVSNENYNADTINRTRWQNIIKASAAITSGHIICGDSDGYQNIGASINFDLTYPLLWANTSLAATKTGDNNFLQINGINLSSNGTIQGAAQYTAAYLKGTISGNIFTIAATNYLTCTIPTEVDNYFYIPLGIFYNSTTNIYFNSSKDLYAFLDGKFRQVTPTEIVATHQIYYRTDTAATVNDPIDAPTSWITTSTNVYDQWTTKVPPLAADTDSDTDKYPYLYTCEQRKRLDGTCECTDVLLDENTTVIDGGTIVTGSVAANKITVNDLSAFSATIGGFDIDSTSIHTANVEVTSNAENSIALSSTDFTRTLNGTAQTLRFAMGSNFGVTKTGTMFASKGYIGKYEITGTYLKTGSGTTATGIGGNQAFWAGSDTSDSAPFRVAYDGTLVATSATLTGTIYATAGYIGSSATDGWSISGDIISHGTIGSSGGYVLNAAGNSSTKLNGSTSNYNNLALVIGSKFGVANDGTLYANGANITGINASNITAGTLSASYINTSGITTIGASNGRHLSLTSSGLEVLNNTTKYLVISENSVTKYYSYVSGQLALEGCYTLYQVSGANGSNGSITLSYAPSHFSHIRIEYTVNNQARVGVEYGPVHSVDIYGSASYVTLDASFQADNSNKIIQTRTHTYQISGSVMTLKHYLYANFQNSGVGVAINQGVYISRVVGYF